MGGAEVLERGGAIYQAVIKEMIFLKENPAAPGARREVDFLCELVEALAIEHYVRDEPTEKDFEELRKRIY